MNYTTEICEATLDMASFKKRFVNVEKFLGYCRECPNYNVRHACPGYDFDPNDLWDRYENVRVVGVKIGFPAELVGTTVSKEEYLGVYMDTLRKESRKLYDSLKAEETAAEGRFLLYPGSCDLCGDKPCDRREHECRQPKLRRYSIEALGGDVAAVTKELLGFELLWVEEGVVPAYLCQVGGIMY